ncbi:MAG: FtsX-like permease family protein [Bacteroidota bacterium]
MLRPTINLLFRTIARNKTFSLLNIGGLAIGITCASFIFLWVENELTFNHHFIKRDHLYAVMETPETPGQVSTLRGGPVPLAEGIKHTIPGIKNTARINSPTDQFFVIGDKIVVQSGQYADSSILSILNFNFLYGTTPSLTSPESIIISQSMSNAIFGNTNPVGKTLQTKTGAPFMKDGLFIITGVFIDFPLNSTYQFKWVSPYKIYEDLMRPQWNKWDIPVETLVELEPAADIASVNTQLNKFLQKKVEGSKTSLSLFPMNDWNLYEHFTNGRPDGGKIRYVHLFSLIAGIILLIACINFMNLSTARSEKRAKEVGIRKVSGAHKHELVLHFIRESITMALLAVLLSMVLITVCLPFFNQLLGTKLDAGIFKMNHLLFLLATGLVTGLLSGLYPSFYLSAFKPIAVLKGLKIKHSSAAGFIRKGLVTTQFTISIVLIIATVIIYQQIQYVKARDLGYTTNSMIEMITPENFPARFEAIRQELLQSGAIENAAMAYNPMLHLYTFSTDYQWAGKSPRQPVTVYDIGVSDKYISTMHMQIKSGRDFYTGERVDSNNTVIINETMAKLMGAEGKLGGTITRTGYPAIHIVGIVHDFIFDDMYGQGGPVLMVCLPQACNHLFLSLSAQMNTKDALAKINQVLTTAVPGYPFAYKFADEELNKLFETENMVSRLATIFAVLAIVISCLGLFGLAAYTAEKRTKEIGIRKVLGATVISLAALLSVEFLQLVCVACIIAFPAAWWALHHWLQAYGYRTSIQWWPFAAAGMGALFIALLTVSFQAIKVALGNPVKSLRTE